jgi:hypothetical protein
MPTLNERFEDLLPLLPGMVRGPDGLINMKGARSSQNGSLVNSADVTDPARLNIRTGEHFSSTLRSRSSVTMSMPEIITGNFAPFRWVIYTPNSIRAVDWNIDRGLSLHVIINFLKETNADILILQEVDINARRTRRVNIAQEIAQKLQMNYAFGREFEELTQGSKASPAYHGQATLSRWSISKPRPIRFRRQSSFGDLVGTCRRSSLFRRDLGGRIALVSEIDIAGCRLVT